MKQIRVYQTLENRNNPEYIMENGPFEGDTKVAWLGVGCYFWESFVNNAHWWGNLWYKETGYIICESSYRKDQDSCFDLYDNPEHLTMLREAIDCLRSNHLYIEGETTVSRVIEFLRSINAFTYGAIRAKGENVRDKLSPFGDTLLFQQGKLPYLELYPPIQVCVFDKALLDLHQYKIVFPDVYRDDYLI